ncbi:ABC transporter ATP-binding protein [Hamadaea tsunoensis]|uniref:ABC transporter ATP-binding protein n=1 Tax=Hamadaea tsunoensis TaxID=53368 RepID=UPI0003FEE776|nr:ABC transporter ATP-binding protein [Hamadaea tsunoensis]
MVLKVEGVAVGYGGVPLLKGLDLTVPAGAVAVFRGPNGSGKSTLLRSLAGLVAPMAGTISADGVRADDRDPRYRRTVALLLDGGAWYPDLTAAEHVELVERANGPLPDGWRAAGTFGVEEFAGETPGRLSSGQLQRLALAMVFARPSALLVLDEPERHLDAEGRATLRATLLSYVDAGRAAVVATHDADLAGTQEHLLG